jgi:hypothetical protein
VQIANDENGGVVRIEGTLGIGEVAELRETLCHASSSWTSTQSSRGRIERWSKGPARPQAEAVVSYQLSVISKDSYSVLRTFFTDN